MLACPENTLTADAHERQRRTPLPFSGPAKLNRDGGVAVGVARDGPLEAEVVQRRVLNGEAAGADAVLTIGGDSEQQKQRNQYEAHKSRF